MRFGNTIASIRGGIVVMSILGLLVGVIGLLIAPNHHTLARTWPVAIVLVMVPSVAFSIACLPTLAFSIRLEQGRVKHLLLDHYVLSDFPVASFTAVEVWNRPWGGVIHFQGNKKIRFLGAHFGILGQMQAALERAKQEANKTLQAAAASPRT
jgi:hypothetical protein